mmetsp:Transcript_25473/g.44983  ORF Transcript_25473/g.44983 Transcript_25473/m.44983 type:complete len:92 (-) Transcript_25473:98-373(-)
MFPHLALPFAEALWKPRLLQSPSEARLAQEEARYTALLEAIRNAAPPALPIGMEKQLPPPEEASAQPEEEQDDMEEEEEEFTDDEGPADRF